MCIYTGCNKKDHIYLTLSTHFLYETLFFFITSAKMNKSGTWCSSTRPPETAAPLGDYNSKDMRGTMSPPVTRRQCWQVLRVTCTQRRSHYSRNAFLDEPFKYYSLLNWFYANVFLLPRIRQLLILPILPHTPSNTKRGIVREKCSIIGKIYIFLHRTPFFKWE